MNYLDQLGIHAKVQAFFQPHSTIQNESIYFNYGGDYEHAGPHFHRIPTTEGHWTAGEPAIAGHLIISSSAMDAIAWLDQNHTRYPNPGDLCFLSVGSTPARNHAEHIQQQTPTKKIHFLFSNDPTGALCDLKFAAWIRDKPLKVTYINHYYHIHFEHQHYQFDRLSLNTLEKASRYNFRIRTHKPKNHGTYYQQLRSRYYP